MQNLYTSWGETLPILVEIDDLTASTAKLIVSNTDGTFEFTKSGTFTQVSVKPALMKVDLSFNPSETEMQPGSYNYQLRIDYTGGKVDKYPDQEGCCDSTETFEFPQLVVSKSLDMDQVS